MLSLLSLQPNNKTNILIKGYYRQVNRTDHILFILWQDMIIRESGSEECNPEKMQEDGDTPGGSRQRGTVEGASLSPLDA